MNFGHLGFATLWLLTGCSSSPCKQLLVAEDVQQVLGAKVSGFGDTTKRSCSLNMLAGGSPRGFDVQLDLQRFPQSAVAANLEDAVAQARKKSSVEPLSGFGDEAFVSYVALKGGARAPDANEVVDQMIQRAALERYAQKVNEVAGEVGVDAGFDGVPQTLKKTPRTMGAYLDRLPLNKHQVFFRKGEWVGTLVANNAALSPEQFQQLVGSVASRVAKLE